MLLFPRCTRTGNLAARGRQRSRMPPSLAVATGQAPPGPPSTPDGDGAAQGCRRPGGTADRLRQACGQSVSPEHVAALNVADFAFVTALLTAQQIGAP